MEIKSLMERASFAEAARILEPGLRLPSLESLFSFHVEEDLLERGARGFAAGGLQKRLMSRALKKILKNRDCESGCLRLYLNLCQGRNTRARSEAERLLHRFPKNPIPWLLRAAALWACGDLTQEHSKRLWLAEARRYVQHSISLGGPRKMAILMRAHIHRGMEDNEAAVLDFKALLKDSPADWHLRMLLVEALFETKDLRGALKHLRAVRAQCGGAWWVLAQEAHAHGLSGNLNTALRGFNQAIRLRPRLGSLYAWKAEILRKMGRYQESLRALDQAVRWAPDYIFTRVCRGRLWLMLGEPAKALKDLTAASRICPADRLGSVWRAEALAKLGRWREAFYIFDRILPFEPIKTWNIPIEKGRKPSIEERERGFWNFWAKAIQESPHNPYPRLLRGRFRVSNGENWKTAAEDLTLAYALSRDKATKANVLAWSGQLCLKRGAYKLALADLKRACALKDNALYRSWYALALARTGRFKKASSEWSRALEQPHPRLAPAFVERGKLLWERNRRQEALKDFETAFCMDISYPPAKKWLSTAEKGRYNSLATRSDSCAIPII